MTVTPEAPADIIAERFAGELESAEGADAGALPDLSFVFDSGAAIMIDASARTEALRKALDELQRLASAGTVIATSEDVAERLRVYWAESVMQHLASIEDESAKELEFKRQWAELGHPLDPDDPLVIHRDLPPEHREEFERDYMRALRAARDPRNFGALQRTLRLWRARADVYADPAYQSEHERSLRATESGDFSGYETLETLQARLGL